MTTRLRTRSIALPGGPFTISGPMSLRLRRDEKSIPIILEGRYRCDSMRIKGVSGEACVFAQEALSDVDFESHVDVLDDGRRLFYSRDVVMECAGFEALSVVRSIEVLDPALPFVGAISDPGHVCAIDITIDGTVIAESFPRAEVADSGFLCTFYPDVCASHGYVKSAGDLVALARGMGLLEARRTKLHFSHGARA